MTTKTETTAVNAQPETASLWYKDVRSDKVYNLTLSQCETGWTVEAQYGRRGSTLVADTKIERAEYKTAKRIFDQTLRGKIAKGYKSSETAEEHATRFDRAPGGSAYVGPALTRARQPISKDIRFQPELLTRIDVAEAKLYARNSRYGFQQKRDGVRLTVCVQDGNVFGYNKLGQIVPLDKQLHDALVKFCKTYNVRDLLIDGEWESTGFWAWDLLQFGTVDIRNNPYRERQHMLAKSFEDLPLIHIVPIIWTPDGKLALWNKLQEARAEGFAVKDGNAPYRPGRNGQHYKFKFEITGSFIVGHKPLKKANDGHRSIAVYLLDKGRERFMGTVKVADKYEVPAVGSIVEIRYLYAFPGAEGRIYQPCYFGVVRKDVTKSDCVVQQLKLKQDEEAA